MKCFIIILLLTDNFIKSTMRQTISILLEYYSKSLKTHIGIVKQRNSDKNWDKTTMTLERQDYL